MLILAITDNEVKFETIRRGLRPNHVVHRVENSADVDVRKYAGGLVVDVELRNLASIQSLQRDRDDWKGIATRIFLVDRSSHILISQAYALGATCVLGDISLIKSALSATCEPQQIVEQSSGISASAAALGSLFTAVARGEKIDLHDARLCTDASMCRIQERGLTYWIDRVRSHHYGTFQHCLLVTGVAIDFAVSLSFRESDIRRLGLAATLHDVGKSSIPPSILDKPGYLTCAEREIINQHPCLGYEALEGIEAIEPELLFAVRHHHELLDGSGYPDRLDASGLPDLVRLLTIADIFAALIEYRSYKPQMSRQDAYEVLCGMGTKLDRPLVREFKKVALGR